MLDPAIWRERDGESRRFGIVITRHVATIYYGRSLLRIRWSGPWSR